jgi:two-component system, NtrC family, response regulator AlgB
MTEKGKVLIVDDEQNILKTLSIGLEAVGFATSGFSDPREALDSVEEGNYDIAFIDLMMQPIDGMQVLKILREKSPSTTAVIITAHGSIDSAVEAIRSGAFDFLQKPFDLKEVQIFAEKVLSHHRLQDEIRSLRHQIAVSRTPTEIITRNPLMRKQIDLAAEVADSMLTVLIEGESGTGKELIAQYIHEHSSRAEQPFIKVNCAALAETLLESELFGHVKGAFTGAIKERMGRFEMADHGTIFLDEIGEIPPASQVKLLRFLQHREFERVGDSVTRKVDVRVVAATNRNLADSMKEGIFREDLYYRLNAVRITMPSLRERPEDILLLIYHFVKKFAPDRTVDISPGALALLTGYRWPGNVREMENVMERAVLLAKSGTIEETHLPAELRTSGEPVAGLLSLEMLERRHIQKVLGMVSDLDEAAKILEIDPATLWRKRKKYGL